jgi:hypothetical protein
MKNAIMPGIIAGLISAIIMTIIANSGLYELFSDTNTLGTQVYGILNIQTLIIQHNILDYIRHYMGNILCIFL